MMSASASKLTSAKFLTKSLAGLISAVTLMVGAGANLAYGQDNVPATQVAEMVAKVRRSTTSAAVSLEALSVGQRLLVTQRYAEASELFEALLEKSPREPVVLYGAALAAFNLRRAERAESLVRLATEIYLGGIPDNDTGKLVSAKQRLPAADALVLLAVILGARGDDAQALKTVQRAVAIAPEHFDAQFTLGRALYGMGDSVAAVKAFQSALKIRPDHAKALFFLATTLESAGDSDAALAAYRDLAQRQPQATEGHLGLGVLLIKRGGTNVTKGIEELRTAVRIDPNLYEAQVTLGRALLMQKLAGESIQYLLRAAELAPNNPEPHYQLALAYRRLGQTEKALEESAIVKRIHEARRGEGAQNNPAKPDK